MLSGAPARRAFFSDDRAKVARIPIFPKRLFEKLLRPRTGFLAYPPPGIGRRMPRPDAPDHRRQRDHHRRRIFVATRGGGAAGIALFSAISLRGRARPSRCCRTEGSAKHRRNPVSSATIRGGQMVNSLTPFSAALRTSTERDLTSSFNSPTDATSRWLTSVLIMKTTTREFQFLSGALSFCRTSSSSGILGSTESTIAATSASFLRSDNTFKSGFTALTPIRRTKA